MPGRDDILTKILKTAAVVAALAGMMLITWGVTQAIIEPDPPQPAPQKRCSKCHNRQMAMAIYMRNNKVKSPEEMALAVLSTRNPRLLASLHVNGEKCTPHTARKTGYKKLYSGAWQTHEQWGKIDKNTTITEQALIAEFALTTHVAEEKDIIAGLNAYGGESDKKNGGYALVVLEGMRDVP